MIGIYVVFVDFKKAFNIVFREGLFYKLLKLGCNDKLLKILQNLYSKVKCAVNTPEGITDFFLTLLGVQQGSILSPLLFALYFQDINEFLDDKDGLSVNGVSFKALLYADDLALTSDMIDGLQRLLDGLRRFCKTWKLSVNMTKTSILICKKGKKSENEKWFISHW